MWGLCSLRLLTVWNTSRMPSAFTLSRTVLNAQKVPVRPAPALYAQSQRDRGIWESIKAIRRMDASSSSTNCFVLLRVRKRRAEGSHLQCTVMGWFPDCCCCFCTAAIKLIMPLPSVGMPTSGQPWKWNWRTARALFSCDRGQWHEEQINLCSTKNSEHWPSCFFNSYPVIGDQEVTHRVALVLLLPFYLDRGVAVDHCAVTGPILGTFFLQEMDVVRLLCSTRWRQQGRTNFFGRLSWAAHLPSLFQLSKHDYGAASPLPDHPPEVLHGVLKRALARHVGVLLTVTLWPGQQMRKEIKQDL